MRKIYKIIANNDIRRLNWMTMKYFVKERDFERAAQCRDRVKCWNKNGPV